MVKSAELILRFHFCLKEGKPDREEPQPLVSSVADAKQKAACAHTDLILQGWEEAKARGRADYPEHHLSP